VAVLDYNPAVSFELKESDCDISWFSGTGPGGQNRNKVQASCRVHHRPSGITTTAQTRSRKNSFHQAIEELKIRLKNRVNHANSNALNDQRRQQVGSGQRGDKKRTIQFQHNQATDHETNQRCTAEQYLRGEMYKLWPSAK
jgi:peptide chain release factor 1